MLSALHKKRHGAFVLLVASVGVGLSVLALTMTDAWVRHRMQADFQRDATDIVVALQKSIDANLGILRSIASLYAASERVERDEFQTFVRHGMLERPGIQALEWVPRVPASHRAAYEEAARQEAHPRFQFVERQAQSQMVPATPRDEYFPVYYVEPYEGNEIDLGFDLASNSVYMEAMNEARDTGKKVATGRITLGEEAKKQFGFLVFLPIYRNGAPTETLLSRRENLTGFILGVFRLKDIVAISMARSNLEEAERELVIPLYDRTAQVGQQMLITQSFGTGSRPPFQSPLRLADTFDVGGRSWEIVVATPALPLWRMWQPWAVLMVGLLFTSCLLTYLLASLRRDAIVQRLVATRTLELSHSNRQLEEEIAERKRVEQSLRSSEKRSRELAAASAQAHEEERLRAALEVHDRIGQPLIAAFQQLQTLEHGTLTDSKQRRAAERTTDLLHEAISESRNIMNDLYPTGLEDFGVVRLIDADLASFEEDTGCLVKFDVDCPVSLPRDVEVAFYRILHEALTNIRRHAQSAKNVAISFTCGDQDVVLDIQDDGPGFNVEEEADKKRVGGLVSMQRRAEVIGGSFQITGIPGEGTKLAVRIPLKVFNI